MSHPYDKAADCQCVRCTKERARRAVQNPLRDHIMGNRRFRKRGERTASRAEQHARYIDCGPAAWDDQ